MEAKQIPKDANQTKHGLTKELNFTIIILKKWLKDNDIEMYSIHNRGKSVVAEKFIRTLKNRIFKHITAISKNVYFDVLDDIVNKYNNIVHRTIKMKPIDVTSDSYAEYNEDSNVTKPKFKVGDYVRRFFVVSKIKDSFVDMRD